MASRGTTIITQKENKGEYHGINCTTSATTCDGGYIDNSTTWYWNNDQDIYAHVFDQNGPKNGNEIPYQFSTNTSEWLKSGSEYYAYPNIIPRCTTTTATGETLYSGTHIPSTSKACVANTHNAGNWYSYPAATAGSNNAATSSDTEALNSICPKGWRLPPNSGSKSLYNLIYTTYKITTDTTDIEMLNSPALSFSHLGNYNANYGSLNYRGINGHNWSSTAANSTQGYDIHYADNYLRLHNNSARGYGFSIRCVSR